MFKNRKLKNYILFPRIQIKFLFFTVLTTVFTVGVCLYQTHQSFAKLNNLGQKMGAKEDSPYFRLLEAQEWMIFKNVLIALAISLALSLIVNFIITHRALGPFYRLKIFFGSFEKGRGHKIRFRKTDYFKELEEDINKALE
jgi:hypothetical protein